MKDGSGYTHTAVSWTEYVINVLSACHEPLQTIAQRPDTLDAIKWRFTCARRLQ